MNREPIIRRGVPSDAESLAALAIQVWLHTYATDGISPAIARHVLSEYTADAFTHLLSHEECVLLVAERGGNLVGYVLVAIGAQLPAGVGSSAVTTAELVTLYVGEHFARQGIGSQLLAESRTAVHHRTGSRSIWLSVNARNEPALAFYRSHGFVNIGVTFFELEGQRHENHVLVAPGD